jgi:AraC-like DNA-binding protein
MDIYCGLKQQPRGYAFSASDYEQFQLIYVFAGTVWLTVQNSVTPLHGGDACLLPRGADFRLHSDTGYQGVCVILSAPEDPAFSGPARALTAGPALRGVAELIDAEVRTAGADSVLRHLGLAFAELGLREAAGDAPPADAWVRAACRSIERTIYTSKPLTRCLAGIPVSYRQLSRLFHAALGMTPKQYQLACRLREAQRLLRTTRQPVTTIAYELGFASSQHFSAQFTRCAGITPTAYRRAGE